MTQVSSLYLHVPFCKHLCNYCDFYKKKFDPDSSQFEDFYQFLLSSLPVHASLLAEFAVKWQSLQTVYLGGGTPSLWGPEGASFFSDLIRPMGLAKNCEFTMEIDPGTWTSELLDQWREIGLNRISVGTQSLDLNFLKIMDRVHSLDDTLAFLEVLQKENWNYSLDFLLGIPFSQEKKRDIKKELDTLLAYSPKHISLYILNARSKYPHIQNLPDDEYIREEYLFVSSYLKSLGYHHYEVSNFAMPGFESRHNLKYWQGSSVAALGPTGTGYLALGSAEALRYKWKVSEASFEREKLSSEELELEKIYLSLRTSSGWKPSVEQYPLMEKWAQDNYGIWDGVTVKLTSLGFLMLDSLMNDLFRLEINQK